MPLIIDNIKVGMWIAVVARKECEDKQEPWFGFGTKYVEEYSGMPVQVRAISLPFLAIWNGKMLSTVDTRAYEFVKVDKKYVRVLTSQGVPKKRRKKEKPDPTSRCIRCGERLIQRSVVISKEPYLAEWHYYCRHCNFDGGRVS